MKRNKLAQIMGILTSVSLSAGIFVSCAPSNASNETMLSTGALAPLKEMGTLKIATCYNDRYLDAAVNVFKNKYPGWEVDVKDYGGVNITPVGEGGFMTNYDTAVEEKYVAELTAELMSGNGPDLISMNELPLAKLQRSGVLADLYSYIDLDETITRDYFYANILKAMEFKEKLYILPTEFQVYTLYATSSAENIERPKDKTWSYDEMTAYFAPLLEEKSGASFLYYSDSQAMLRELLQANYAYIVDEGNNTCDFTNDIFLELLNICKSFADDDLFYKEDSFMLLGKINAGLFSDYANLNNGYLFSDGSHLTYKYRFPNPSGITGTAFDSSHLFSINANTSEKTAAWEFMKCLVSDEIQLFPEIWDYPVNKHVLHQTVKNLLGYLDGNFSEEEVEHIVNDQLSFIGEINRAIEKNGDICDLVLQECQPFFEGALTAEEVAAKVQSKISIYFSEQSR